MKGISVPAALSLLLLAGFARGQEEIGANANWPGPGGAPDESDYSRLAAIDRANIGRLGLAWYTDLPAEVTLEGTPIAVDGTLYFTGSYSAVYAVDGRTGRVLWRYDPEIWNHHPERMRYNFGVNRGAAYSAGRVYICTLDGRLIAVDAKTGKPLWSAETIEGDGVRYSTGAPRVIGDKVIIGNAGADYGARGYVTAYDAATGQRAWRFYTAPGSPEENKGDPAMEAAAKTWGGEYWKTGTGGTVWNGMTYDPELKRVYIGTGNSGPYDPSVRSPGGGDNLYLASIVALDAETGKYLWHYQVNPREAWDYKATANIVMATIAVDGHPRKVLMQAPTNGFFYVLDRETGKLLSAGKTGKISWADHIDLKTGRPVEAPNIRYETGETSMWPSSLGTHNWQAMAYSPKAGLAFIPYTQAGAKFSKVVPKPGESSFGGIQISEAKSDAEDGTASLLAWDPVRQQAAWKVRLPTFWNGGTLATAGSLVFQGTADGLFSAYDTSTGKRLWRFDAGLGIQAAPISYAVGGKQYVSVLVGYGGSAGVGNDLMRTGWKFGAQMRRLLTFTLDGNKHLPRPAPPDLAVHPIDDPSIKISDSDVATGRQVYMNCLVCHGINLVSGGNAPDLRESALALNLDTLWSVLHDGALMQNGMPRFDNLSRDQVKAVHAYIRSGARAVLTGHKAKDGGSMATRALLRC